MKVSLSLKHLATKEYKLTAKERLMAIIGIGIVVLGVTVYISTSDVAVESITPSNDKIQKVVPPPSIPSVTIGKQVVPVSPTVEPGVRDPFSKPPEINIQKNGENSSLPVIQNNIPNNIPNTVPSMVPKNTFQNSVPQQDFKLTGIVSGGNTSLAVIMSGSTSRSYGINDRIGSYRLTAINGNDVILTNGNGKVVLHLESFGQKEGKTSEK